MNKLNSIKFNVMAVIECYCKIGSEFYHQDRMTLDYNASKYNEASKDTKFFNRGDYGLQVSIKPYEKQDIKNQSINVLMAMLLITLHAMHCFEK